MPASDLAWKLQQIHVIFFHSQPGKKLFLDIVYV